jgi:cobalt/nickel transport system permease protein
VLRNNKFIERSILGALSFLKESVFADEYALKKGILQSARPESKIVVLLSLVVLVLFARDWRVLAALYGACLFFAVLSKIPVLFFLKRTWVFIPLFSLFVAVPALFDVFTPGEALVTWTFLGQKLTVTRPGLWGAVIFVARVATSVSLVVLLTLTTRHFALLKCLRFFGIPAIFVMTLGMCTRYVYLFVTVVEHTYLAIRSRVGRRVACRKGQEIVAWSIASLWTRSHRLHEEVYQAMVSRGYRGEA